MKTIELTEKVVFDFAYKNNAERVAIALCQAGFFVNIRIGEKDCFEVLVFKLSDKK